MSQETILLTWPVFTGSIIIFFILLSSFAAILVWAQIKSNDQDKKQSTPSPVIPSDPSKPIFAGNCLGHGSFEVNSNDLTLYTDISNCQRTQNYSCIFLATFDQNSKIFPEVLEYNSEDLTKIISSTQSIEFQSTFPMQIRAFASKENVFCILSNDGILYTFIGSDDVSKPIIQQKNLQEKSFNTGFSSFDGVLKFGNGINELILQSNSILYSTIFFEGKWQTLEEIYSPDDSELTITFFNVSAQGKDLITFLANDSGVFKYGIVLHRQTNDTWSQFKKLLFENESENLLPGAFQISNDGSSVITNTLKVGFSVKNILLWSLKEETDELLPSMIIEVEKSSNFLGAGYFFDRLSNYFLLAADGIYDENTLFTPTEVFPNPFNVVLQISNVTYRKNDKFVYLGILRTFPSDIRLIEISASCENKEI